MKALYRVDRSINPFIIVILEAEKGGTGRNKRQLISKLEHKFLNLPNLGLEKRNIALIA